MPEESTTQTESHALLDGLLKSDDPAAELSRIAEEYNIADWGQKNEVSAGLYSALRDMLGTGVVTGNDLVTGIDTQDPRTQKAQFAAEKFIAAPQDADPDHVQKLVLGYLRAFVSQLTHPGTKTALFAKQLPELIKLHRQLTEK